MKKISKILLTTVAPATILTTATLASCGNKQNQELIHKPVFPKTKAIANKITVIDCSSCWGYQDDMNVLFQSLEGILAQTKAEIFVCSGDTNRDKWFYDMYDKYHFDVEYVGSEGIWDVLAKYKNVFNSKYVKYIKTNDTNKECSINRATMISACERCLMISDNILNNSKYQEKIIQLGLSESETSAITSTTSEILNKYGNQLNKTIFLHQSPLDFPLRDYAIANKMPVVCAGLDDECPKEEIADFMNDNAPMLGWSCGFENEQEYVHWASENNLVVLAADHAANLSFYSYDYPKIAFKQYDRPKIKAKKGKHYVAIVMSDGDNIQWMQNDLLRARDYWGSPHRGKFPISWTISPSVIDVNPSILDEMYATATKNDHIIAGPSGFGYINPAYYKDENVFNKFAKTTADYMHDCDLTCINTLDFRCPEDKAVPDYHCMEPYLNQDQVKGIVWAVTDLSLSGHGSVDWINDKPILSFREGFWDKEVLRVAQVAARINSYPRDPSRIDGYTAITACVWNEGKMDKINEFVKLLDKNVELVTIDQMLQMITDNVEHKSAMPEQYAPWDVE